MTLRQSEKKDNMPKNNKHADMELRNGNKENEGIRNGKGNPNEKQTKGLSKKDATDCTQHWEDPEHMKHNQEEYKKFQAANRRTTATQQNDEKQEEQDQDVSEASDDHDSSLAPKRGHGANSKASPNKKQKTNGSAGADKGDGPRGKAGDKTRVPREGERVQWHSLPGYVDGEVVEVVYEEKVVQGKKVKGSKEDPRVVLRSEKSGKICVHKPESVYF